MSLIEKFLNKNIVYCHCCGEECEAGDLDANGLCSDDCRRIYEANNLMPQDCDE